MRKLTLLFLLFGFLKVFGQECDFNPQYSYQGDLSYLSVFRDKNNNLAQGVCDTEMENKQFLHREFKNGLLMVQRVYDAESGTTFTEFKRVKKDSVFAELVIKSVGNVLESRTSFYLNKQGIRCWKEENYLEGKLWRIRFRRALQNQELIAAGYSSLPPNEIDGEGYTTIYVIFGRESEYYPNGKIHIIKDHKVIVSPNYYYSDEHTIHGKYVEYYENGVELEHGTYLDGQKNGEFVYHHMNGKISARKTFTNGLQTGKWKEYYENGKLLSVTEFGDQYLEQPGSEKRYYPSGKLQFESKFKRDTVCYEREYYESGVQKSYRLFRSSKESKETDLSYFPDGKVKSRWYNRPHDDTTSVEYSSDGSVKSVRLTFKDDDRQEYREYYPNHQLAREEYSDRKDRSFHQAAHQYYENGKKKLFWETSGESGRFYHTKEFWSNGSLKTEKQFDYHILNGYWTELDSLGRVLKKCHYTNGFRDSLCEVTPEIKLEPLTADQEKCLLPLVVHQITQRKHDANTVVDEADINEEVSVLRKVEQFLRSTWFSEFQFCCEPAMPTSFHYSLYMPNAEYAKYKSQIDSIIKVLNWSKVQPDCSCMGHFNSTKLYSPLALDSVFKSVIPDAGKYFYLDHVTTSVIFTTGNIYDIQPSISLERKEKEKAWLADVYGNKVVVYDDGIIENYNGSTFSIQQPVPPFVAVDHVEWKVVKQTKVKKK